MDNVFQFLRELTASGRLGTVIIALALVIVGALFVIWLQRQFMARIDSHTKAVEISMNAAEIARDRSIAVQKEIKEGLEKQFDFVVRTNDELRKELERYRSNQVKFEDDIKKALSLGLDEMKLYLSKVTVLEIVSQIPESFRRDLENEIGQVADRAIPELIRRLKDSETDFIDQDLKEKVSKVVESAIQDTIWGAPLE